MLTLVDIPAHEEPLKELAKTSLLNNVTVLLCWSAAEGARYLELYKGLEHAPPTGIKGQKKGTYRECMEGFVTVPRGINRSDAISVVSACGSVRGAVNVEPEVLGSLGGWGEVKVRRWTAAVREPFRAGKAKKRTIRDKLSRDAVSKGLSVVDVDAMAGIESQIEDDAAIAAELEEKERREREARKVQERRKSPNPMFVEDDEVVIEDDAAIATEMEEEERRSREKRTAESQAGAEQRRADDGLSGGVAAALAKLRQG